MNSKTGKYENFGNLKVVRTEDLDGYKFFFEDDTWVMIRPSGTEPVLRVYAEAPGTAESFTLLRGLLMQAFFRSHQVCNRLLMKGV